MSGGPATRPSPPFNALTFNLNDIPIKKRAEWSHDPDIVIDDPGAHTEYDAKSAHEYYRRNRATKVSRAVFALGKNPYPGLHDHRYISELQTKTSQYDPRSPWMGKNPVLRYITPSELERLGCINLETDENPNIEISPRFRVDTTTLATASTDRNVVTTIGNNDGIHPSLERSNWKDTSDAEYEYLKPVLRIATGMMAMDGILDLWNALGQPLKHFPRNKMLRDQKQKHWVYYTGRTSPAQRGRTQLEMLTLRHFVTFSWKHKQSENGSTKPDVNKRGLRPGDTRHACRIRIDTHLRYIICRGGTKFDATYYNPAASNTSAYMRTQLFLADTIVHELTHAWFENVTDESGNLHPFRNDDRVAEEGYAAETSIHKDVLLAEMDTNISIRTMPFGLRADRWPGPFYDNGYAIKASAAKYGIKSYTSYAVPMSYVHQFFLDDFWDNRILRFGDGALSNYKAVGVRLCHNFKFDALESPTVRKKRNPITGVEEEDPETESDAEFPDVDKGIIYHDKVLPLSGEEILDPDTEMRDGDESEEEHIDEIEEDDNDDGDGGIMI